MILFGRCRKQQLAFSLETFLSFSVCGAVSVHPSAWVRCWNVQRLVVVCEGCITCRKDLRSSSMTHALFLKSHWLQCESDESGVD